jgi:uncharacterized membrane protein
MDMTKKDRIAVVISTLVLFFVLVCFIDGKNADFQGGGYYSYFFLCATGVIVLFRMTLAFLKVRMISRSTFANHFCFL